MTTEFPRYRRTINDSMKEDPRLTSHFTGDRWYSVRKDLYADEQVKAYNAIKRGLAKHREAKRVQKIGPAATKIQAAAKKALFRKRLQEQKNKKSATKTIQAAFRRKKDLNSSGLTYFNKQRMLLTGKKIRELEKNKITKNGKQMKEDIDKMVAERAMEQKKRDEQLIKESEEAIKRLGEVIENNKPEKANAKKSMLKYKPSAAALKAAKTRPKKVVDTQAPLRGAEKKPKKATGMKERLAAKRAQKHAKECKCAEGIKTHFVRWESYHIGAPKPTNRAITIPKVAAHVARVPPNGTEVTITNGDLAGTKGTVQGTRNKGQIIVKPYVVKSGIKQVVVPISMLKYKRPKTTKVKLAEKVIDIPHKFTYLEVCNNCATVWTDIGETSMAQPGEDGTYRLGRASKSTDSERLSIYDELSSTAKMNKQVF